MLLLHFTLATIEHRKRRSFFLNVSQWHVEYWMCFSRSAIRSRENRFIASNEIRKTL